MSESDPDHHPAATTTITTIAVQAGEARIILAVLKSKEWLQLKVEEMEPELVVVGSNLEEALRLQRQHDDMLSKLQSKQQQIEELLSQADQLITTQKPQTEVYEAMAESLGEAWKDLNIQLEYRKHLLSQSVAFHRRSYELSERMDSAFQEFNDAQLPYDVSTAQLALQRHHDIKKGILEASMHALNESQVLLERIKEGGVHADSRNRNITISACSGVEFIVEQLHDRKRQLEELWLQRKTKLEQCLELCILYQDLKEIVEWLTSQGEDALRITDLGESVTTAELLQHEHNKLETEAKKMQDRVLRLVRTTEQLVHAGHYDGEAARTRALAVQSRCSNFMSKVDNRRKLLAMSVAFFRTAQTALTKLDQIEVQLTTSELPRNSTALAQHHANLANTIEELTLPAIREGHILLERVSRDVSGVHGVANMVAELEGRRFKLTGLCTAHKQQNLEKSANYNFFMEKYNIIYTWIINIGEAFLNSHQDFGSVLAMAKDFLEHHEQLFDDVKDKDREVQILLNSVPDLVKSGDQDALEISEKAEQLRIHWRKLCVSIDSRVRLSLLYVNFHKLAVQLASEIDALDEILKSEKDNAQSVTEFAIKHNEERWIAVLQIHQQLEDVGNRFIADAEKSVDPNLDSKRAILCVQTLMDHFNQRKFALTQLWEAWQLRVSIGKEFKVQWHQYVEDAKRTITSIIQFEKQPLRVYIPANLGEAFEAAKTLEKRLEDFLPMAKKAQAEIELRLKTAEMLALKGETQGQKDQIVNDLIKVHQQFQKRITDYQVILSMTIAFYKNLHELDKLIAKAEKQYSSMELPRDVFQAEIALKEYEGIRETINELIKFTSNEGKQILDRVRIQGGDISTQEEILKVIDLLEIRRTHWDTFWIQQRKRLDQLFQLCHFNKEYQLINSQIDDLNSQIQSRKGNYGDSLTGVRMTSQAFIQLQRTVELLENRIKQFTSTAEKMISDQHFNSPQIHTDVDTIVKKWSTLHLQVGEYRICLDLCVKYFELVEEVEEWYKEGSKLLISIGRKSTECKSPEDARNLLLTVQHFISPSGERQEHTLREMSNLAEKIYGRQAPAKVAPFVGKHKEIMESFLVINKELCYLADNLKTQQQMRLMNEDSSIPAKIPKLEAQPFKQMDLPEIPKALQTPVSPPPTLPKPVAPKFIVLLRDDQVMEGTKYKFECRVIANPWPEITWFKDGIPITNNPDYQTNFIEGLCTLTIEETFSEDSARFTCRAINAAGTADTYGRLTVKESQPHEEMIPPEFLRKLDTIIVKEGSPFEFVCEVIGNPIPVVSWFKNDICIDNSPDYVITFNNGICKLTFEEVFMDDNAQYTCSAFNIAGQAATTAKLNVEPLEPMEAPSFPQPLSNVMARTGQKVKLESRVKGQPIPQIMWLHNNKILKENRDFKITFDGNRATLIIAEAFPKDAGFYVCSAKNIAGEAYTSCNVMVKGRLTMDTSDSEFASDLEPVKPRFVHELKNAEVMEGNKARLDCVIIGTPEPEVIWYHDEKPVKESNDFQLLFEGDRCSLIIREAYLEDAGDYRCVAINSAGEAVSSCRLHVEPLTSAGETSDIEKSQKDILISLEIGVPPKFVRLLTDLTVSEAEPVRFECKVSGVPEPNISWYKDGKLIGNSTDYQITKERSGLLSLVIPEAFSEDAGNYVVKASNKAGEAKCFAHLFVNPVPQAKEITTRIFTKSRIMSTDVNSSPPEFQRLFQDLRVPKGNSARFECIITGNPKPKIQWYFKGEPVSLRDYHVRMEGDKHVLSIPEVSAEDAGRFSITAENVRGKATCSALLIVDDYKQPGLVDGITRIEERVQKTYMTKETTITDSQQIQGDQTLYQQSIVREFPKTPTYERIIPIQSFGHQTFVTKEIREEPVFSPQAFDKPIPPNFVQPIRTLIMKEGTTAIFEGVVTGKPEPTITWYKDGQELPQHQSSYGKVCLVVPNISQNNVGKYTCTARNIAGTASSSADLIVKANTVTPHFIQRLESRVVNAGERVQLVVRVTGVPTPEVTWQTENQPITNSPDYQILCEGEVHSLIIPEVFAEDSGKYTVRASNPAGEAISTAELLVQGHSPPTTPMERKVRFQTMTTVQTSQVTRTPQQPFLGVESPSPKSGVVEVMFAPQPTGDRYTLQPPAQEVGTPLKSPPAPFSTRSPPNIIKPLQNINVQEKQRVVFECNIQGEPVPEIKWFREGSHIDPSPDFQIFRSHDGTCKLTIPEAYPEDSGKYTCSATNVAGSKSTTAYLIVQAFEIPKVPPPTPEKPKLPVAPKPVVSGLIPPRFEKLLRNYKYMEGGSATFECKVVGDPFPQIVWSRKGIPIKSIYRHSITTNEHTGTCSLHISMLLPEDEGEYTCTAINPAGEASTTGFILAEDQYAEWLRQEKERITIRQKTTTIREYAYPQEKPDFIQKRTDYYQTTSSSDMELDSNKEFAVEIFESRLLREVNFRTAITKHTSGSETEPDTDDGSHQPPIAPQFIQKPKSTQLLEGGDVTFQCIVTGRPKPKITWFKNGQRVGVTHQRCKLEYKDQLASLHIRLVLPDDAGYYTVLAENFAGRDVCSAHLGVETIGTTTSDTSFVRTQTLSPFICSPISPSPAFGRTTPRPMTPTYRPVSPAPIRPISPKPPTKTTTVRFASESDQEYKKRPIGTPTSFYSDHSDYSDADGYDVPFEKHLLPQFIRIPADKQVREGQLIRFDCRVTGRPYPEVIWFHEGQPVNDDITHKVIVNEGGIHSLLITASSRFDHGKFTCIARNKGGEARFEVFLTVIEKEQVVPPKFIQRFTSTRVREGEPISLHCRAVGAPIPGMTWQKDGIQIFTDYHFRIDIDNGCTSLNINEAQRYDSAWYQCTAQNIAGSTTTRARLTVQEIPKTAEPVWSLNLPKPSKVIQPEDSPPRETVYLKHVERTWRQLRLEDDEPIGQKPAFITHIKDLPDLKEGDRAHFECRLIPIGDPDLRVEWYVNGRILQASSRVMTSFNFGIVSLDILYVYPDDAGVYTCRAYNELGEAVTTATMKIESKKSIVRTTQYPESLPKIQHLESQPVHYIDSIDDRSTQKPAFTVPLKNLDGVPEGHRAHFEGQLIPLGDPYMKVDWFLNGKPLTAGSRISTIFNFGYVALDILNVRPTDAGVYMCRATNLLGEAITTATLKAKVLVPPDTVDTKVLQKLQQVEDHSKLIREVWIEDIHAQKPLFKTQLKDQSNLAEGQRAHFEANLIPVGDPNLKVQWYRNGIALPAGSRLSTTHDFGYVSLDINPVRAEDNGVYTCRAWNDIGEASSSAKLFCKSEKKIISTTQHTESLQKIQYLEDTSKHTHEQYVDDGRSKQKPRFVTNLKNLDNLIEAENAHLEARLEPSSDPNMKVEWYFNRKPLGAAHRYKTFFDFGYVALDIIGVYAEDSGEYSCRATNELGEAVTTAIIRVGAQKSILSESQHPEGLEKIQYLEDASRYTSRETYTDYAPSTKPTLSPLRGPPSLKEGQAAHLECQVEPRSDPSLKIEWFVNGRPLKAGHRFRTTFDFGYVALDILTVYPEDGGEYTVKATNNLGSAQTSTSITITAKRSVQMDTQYPSTLEKIHEMEYYQRRTTKDQVDEFPKKKPAFTKPLHDIPNLKEGQSAHLECCLEPVGDPTMKVEWFFNGKPLMIGHRFRTTFDFGYVALDILTVYSEDSGQYSVRATNDMGEAITSANIRISAKQSIYFESQHPEGLERIQEFEDAQRRFQKEDQIQEERHQKPHFVVPLRNLPDLKEGQTAHLECQLRPTNDPTLKVEWFVQGKPLQHGHRFRTTFDFGYVALDILTVYPEDNGDYTVRATSSSGEATTSATIHCSAKRSIFMESQYPQGMQKIQHLEDASKVTKEYIIDETPKRKPEFVVPLHNLPDLKEGQAAHLECQLQPIGDPTLQVEWFFNGKPLMTGHRFRTYFDFGYVALDILTVYAEDTGEYTVRATNALGSAHTSCSVRVIAKSSIYLETQHPEGLEKIQYLEDASRHFKAPSEREAPKQKPRFTKPLRSEENLTEGMSVHLECRLQPVGDPTLKVEWSINGRALQFGHRFRTSHEFDYVALDILTVYAEDSGVYTCKATNDVGDAVTSASVRCQAKRSIYFETQHPEGLKQIQHLEQPKHRQVWIDEVPKMKPRFITQLKNLDNLKEGQSAHLESRLEPVTDPDLKIEWFHNGRPLEAGHRFRTIYDFGYVALDILYVYPEDSGTFTCRATNRLGTDETTATVNCSGKSSIIMETQHPEGLEKIQYLETHKEVKEIYVEEKTSQNPVFTSPLKNIEISEGQPAHFECRLIPVGDPKLKVEWFHNSKPLKAGTRITRTHDFGFVALDISCVYPEDSGTYTCKASNELGEAVTSASLRCHAKRSIYSESQHPEGLEKIQYLEDASRYIKPSHVEEKTTQAPVFTQPFKNVNNIESTPTHFEGKLIPVGDPKLKVEWYHNGKPLQTGTRFTLTHDFGFVALDILYTYAEDSGTFTCRAINELGEAVTTANLNCQAKRAILSESQHPEGFEKIKILEESGKYRKEITIEEGPKMKPNFITTLTNQDRLVEGQSTHLECRLEPVNDPTLKVEWFFNGKPLEAGHRFRTTFDFGYVALDILTVYAEDSGEYLVRASNTVGEATTKAIIKISAKRSIFMETQHPEGLEKIQHLEDIPRYKTETQLEDSRPERPQFITPLNNLENLKEGQSAHLECRLIPTNDPKLKVDWYVNGVPVKAGHRFRTTHDFGYVALDILTIYPEDSGVYMARATNEMGEAVTSCSVKCEGKRSIIFDTQHPEGLEKIQLLEDTSKYTRETVIVDKPNQRPVFLTPLQNLDNLVEGQSAHLESRVEPIHDPKLKVEWFFNGIPIQAGHRFRTTHDFGYVALDILYSYPEDSGVYMCKATNELGEAVITASIRVSAKRKIYYDTQHPEGLEKIHDLESHARHYQESVTMEVPTKKPVFIQPLKDMENLMEGQQIHLECRVEPVNDPKLRIEWFFNDVPLKSGHRFRLTFDFGYVALDILGVYSEESGVYKCRAFNELGEAFTSAKISVTAKRSIYLESQNPEGLEKIQLLEDQSRKHAEIYIEPKTFQRPVFTYPLQNLDNLIEGQNAHLECRLIPVGDPKLKVEWFFNEKPLDAGTRFTYTHDFGYVALDLAYVNAEDTGVYMCRAHNELGEAVTTASLKIKPKRSIITESQHPEGLDKIAFLESKISYEVVQEEQKFGKPVFTQTLRNIENLQEGQGVRLECRLVPVGDPTLKVEWFVNGILIKTGSRFFPTHDFGLVALDILTIYSEDSGIYMCKATNAAGEAVTTATVKCLSKQSIYLASQHPEGYKKIQAMEDAAKYKQELYFETRPTEKPVFIRHLVSIENLREGDNVHLDAVLQPVQDETLKVEWFRNGLPLTAGHKIRTGHDFGLVTLDILSVYPEDSGIYSCRASNPVGEAVTSATIKCTGKRSILLESQHPEGLEKILELEDSAQKRHEYYVPEPEFDKPLFISHLNNQDNLREGDNAHFECRVEPAKDATLKIEWFINGKPLPAASRFNVIYDFGYVALDISHVYAEDSGVYMVKASNKTGEAVTTGTLKCISKRSILYDTQHPHGIAGMERIEEVERLYTIQRSTAAPEDAVRFDKPFFTIPLQATFSLNEGENVHYECRVQPAQDPKLVIEWYFNGKSLDVGTRFTLMHDFGIVTLDITGAYPRDSGVYTCKARNDVGEAFTSTTLQIISKSNLYLDTLHPEGQKGMERIMEVEDSLQRTAPRPEEVEVGGPPRFTSQFQNLDNLYESDSAHFECTLAPVGDQSMVVEWFFNGQPLKASHRIRTIYSFGFVVLEIIGVYPEDTGEYTCKATNKYGMASIAVTLRCTAKRSLYLDTQHPEGLEKMRELDEMQRSTFTSKVHIVEEDSVKGQKPCFITHPKSVGELQYGDSAHFECQLIPVGDPNLKIEWFFNGKQLQASSRIKTVSDFGFVVLDISKVQPEDTGEYVCRAYNLYGEDQTKVTLSVTGRHRIIWDSQNPQGLDKIRLLEEREVTEVRRETQILQAPQFITEIQSLTTLTEGDGAHFEARLTPVDDPDLSVEWFFNGKPIQTGHRFRTIHDFGFVILDILYVYAEDSGEYVCKATNKLGHCISKAYLTCKGKGGLVTESQLPEDMRFGNEKIRELEAWMHRSRSELIIDERKQAPVFITPLENIPSLKEGDNAHFEAKLTPIDDPDLTVSWYCNGKPIKTGSRVKTIHDFGFVILEISPVYSEDSGEYTCIAINKLGEAVTKAIMKCHSKRSIILETQLPKSMESGLEHIQELENYGTGMMPAVWADAESNQPPTFITKLQDITIKEGDLVHLECRLIPVNDPTLKVEWYFNGKPLVHGTRFKMINDFGFIILEITGTFSRDSGIYVCRAVNKYGEASCSATLKCESKRSVIFEPQLTSTGIQKIKELEDTSYRTTYSVSFDDDKQQAPVFTTQLQDQINFKEGDSTHFECRLEPLGDQTMTVEWLHNGQPMKASSRIRTINDFGFVVLEIIGVTPEDSGEYICRATNKYGTAMTRAILKCSGKRGIVTDTQLPEGMSMDRINEVEQYLKSSKITYLEEKVKQPPVFVTQLKSISDLREGESAHFECRLTPIDDPKLKVEWYVNGKLLGTGHRFKTTHDFGFVALDILYVYATDSGEYKAVAKNELGEAVTTATLHCKSKRSIILESQLPKHMQSMEKIQQLEQIMRYTTDVHLGEEDLYEKEKAQPPIFRTHIQDQTNLNEGDAVKLECQLSPIGDPNLKVEWFWNGKPLMIKHRFRTIHDFGYVALEIDVVYPEDSGYYLCKATNLYGSDTTKAVIKCEGKRSIIYDTQLPGGTESIQLIEEEISKGFMPHDIVEAAPVKCAPDFVLVPRPLQVLEGEAAKFECKVKGYPKPRVQWFINNRIILSGSRYQVSFDGMMHFLDIPKARQYDAGDVIVLVKNSEGQRSYRTTLDVFPREDIRTHLKPIPHEPDNYNQWEIIKEIKESDDYVGPPYVAPYPVAPPHVAPPQVTPPHVAPPVPPVHKAEHAIVLKPKAGQTVQQMQAKTAEDTVKTSTQAIVLDTRKPGMVQKAQRFDGNVDESSSTSITTEEKVEKSGSTTIITQTTTKAVKKTAVMEHVTASVVPPGMHIQEQTTAIIPKPVQKPPPQKFEPPQFTKKLVPCRTKEGTPAKFECEFTGSPTPDITWFRENFQIQNSRDFQITTTQNTSTLIVPEVFLEDSGFFTVKATNRAGVAESKANLVVEEQISSQQIQMIIPPSFTMTIQDNSVKAGQPCRFDCKVTGSTPMEIIWLKNGKKITTDIRFKLLTEEDTNTMLIIEAFPQDAGIYECVAVNQAGEARCRAQLYVDVQAPEQTKPPVVQPPTPPVKMIPPKVVEQPKDSTVNEGQPAVFLCKITGQPVPQISWYRGSDLVKPSKYFQMTVQQSTCTLKISEAFPEDEGTYRCVGVNPAGQASCQAKLKIVALVPDVTPSSIVPFIVKPVTDIVIIEGNQAIFTTQITGQPAPSVSWLRENTPIQQSKDFQMSQSGDVYTLTIRETFPEDAGVFTVRAVNKNGRADSTAQLIVESKP